MLSIDISPHARFFLYSPILSLKTFSPWFINLLSSPLLIKCHCRCSWLSFSPLISTKKGKRLKILSKVSFTVHKAAPLKQAGLATVESYSLIKTLEKALIANEDFSYGELLLTANCNVLLFFELLCASHAEVTVLVLIHSTSKALPLILSSFHLENPGCMFAECLHFSFLDREQAGEGSHQFFHSVPLHVAVPCCSWEVAANEPVPSSIPLGCCGKENPTHR